MTDYLVLRERTYHYRRRVPADVKPLVGRTWWKQSLRLTDRRAASQQARALAVVHDALIAETRAKKDVQRLAEMNAKFIALNLEIIAPRLSRLDQVIATGKVPSPVLDKGTVRKLKKLLVEREALVEPTRRLHAQVGSKMLERATSRMHELSREDGKRITDAGGLARFFNRVRAPEELNPWLEEHLHTEEEREIRAARHLLARRRYEEDKKLLGRLGASVIGERDDPNNPRMTVAMEQWFEATKQSAQVLKRHRTAVRRFVELHGDQKVRDITFQDVERYRDVVENLPDHRRLPTAKRGGLATSNDLPRIKRATVTRHLVSIIALLNFCRHKRWVRSNEAVGVAAAPERTKTPARRWFEADERRKILERAVLEHGENGDMPWLIRLGAYTGARLEELAQLACSNVREIDGVWVVDINDLDGRTVKTPSSVRLIPIHPAICEAFVKWVSETERQNVFASFSRAKYDSRFASTLSGDFGRLMDRAGLPDASLVFHSFRHTLKREMSNAGVDPDVRRAILGHSAEDAHDVYAGHGLEGAARELAKMRPLF